MARVVDLTGENVTRQRRKERNYGTKTDLASTVVERGSTHWAEGSNVHIDGLLGVAGTATVSGTLRVSGLLDVTGTLNASGQINLSGSTAITGPLNVTGPTTLDGVLDIGGDTTITGTLSIEGDSIISGKLDVTGAMSTKGTLSVEGVTTLKNDLNVTTGGKIKAGNLEIEPAGGGQINFAGGSIAAGQFGLGIIHNTGVQLQGPTVVLNTPAANISGNLKVNGTTELVGRTTVRERLVLPGTPTTSTNNFVPNVYIDSNGFIYRTTWSPS